MNSSPLIPFRSSFSNLSVTSPTSQLILQPFHRFTYVTAHSPTLPLLYLRHSSFSNPSFVSPTSQALHLIHLASRPWKESLWRASITGIYRIPSLGWYVKKFFKTSYFITEEIHKKLFKKTIDYPSKLFFFRI